MQEEYCPTGIQWDFDSLIGGGFLKGNVALITGEEGIGKTLFGLEFLYNGAKFYNENGLLILLDESKESIRRYFNQIGWQVYDTKDDFMTFESQGKGIFLKTFSKHKKREFHPASPSFLGRKKGEPKISGEIYPYDIINSLDEYIKDREKEIRRIVIDPLPILNVGKEDIDTMIAFYQKIRELSRQGSDTQNQPVSLLISHFIDGQSYWPAEIFYADVVIKMIRKTLPNGKIIRIMIPSKNRGANIDMCEYAFEIRDQNYPSYKITYVENGSHITLPGIWVYNTSFETFKGPSF